MVAIMRQKQKKVAKPQKLSIAREYFIFFLIDSSEARK
jgi:hypothetical protein